jgi:hypothetical protein
LAKNGSGYILGDFSRTRLVTLDEATKEEEEEGT